MISGESKWEIPCEFTLFGPSLSSQLGIAQVIAQEQSFDEASYFIGDLLSGLDSTRTRVMDPCCSP